MPLSKDPEKRARQLANIQRAYPKVKAKYGLEGERKPPVPEEPEPAPQKAGLEVIDYDEPQQEPHAPAPEAKAEPEAAGEPEPEAAGEPEPEAAGEPAGEPEPEAAGEPERRGFLSGFFDY